MAQIASAECSTPPTKVRAMSEMPSSPFGSAKTFFLPFHSETWAWQPLPVRSTNGFGMKVARKPCFSAIDFAMYLKKT